MSYPVHLLREVDSTNSFAKENIANFSHKTLILARRQLAGRGRGQNTWLTKEGNFTGSIILKPQGDFSFEQAGQLSFVTSCAIFKTLRDILSDDVHIGLKWPNDVYVLGKKISGILIEVAESDNKNIQSLIIGTGINLKNKPDIDTAICLHDILEELPDLKIFADSYTANFDMIYQQFLYEGFEPIRDHFLEHAINIGQEITIRLNNKEFRAIYKTIDERGQLVVEHADGRYEKIASADIFF